MMTTRRRLDYAPLRLHETLDDARRRLYSILAQG